MFDNEKHYENIENGHREQSPAHFVPTSTTTTITTKNVLPSSESDLDLKTETPALPVQQQQQLAQSDSISLPAAAPKQDDTITPTAAALAYDNSFTSDPSEATNTISDDATVISQSVKYPKEEALLPAAIIVEEIIAAPIAEEKIAETVEETLLDDEVVVASVVVAVTASQPPVRKEEDAPFEIDAAEVYQMIDSIRQMTNLSHTLSCTALNVVLAELEAIYSTKISRFIEPLAAHLSGPLAAPDNFIEHTHDSQRLKIIFAQLADCKNDSEQRTWVLHEDEQFITKFLTELIDILV